MDGNSSKKMIDQLDSIETMIPEAIRVAIENGKDPSECYGIYNRVTELLVKIKSEINSISLTDEDELNRSKL